MAGTPSVSYTGETDHAEPVGWILWSTVNLLKTSSLASISSSSNQDSSDSGLLNPCHFAVDSSLFSGADSVATKLIALAVLLIERWRYLGVNLT